MSCRPELVRIRSGEIKTQVLESVEQQTLVWYLIETAEEEELPKIGVLISLYMGLRIGEVCALRREDLQLEDGILHVRGTMQRIQNLNSNGGKKTRVVITEPKSQAAIRDIPIPDFLWTKLNVLADAAPDTWILTGKSDAYIEPRTLENRFHSYLKKCGLRQVNFHTLRHTFATRCIENGFDPKSLSEILGHTSVNITLNRYVHSSMDLKRKNMDLFSRQVEELWDEQTEK